MLLESALIGAGEFFLQGQFSLLAKAIHELCSAYRAEGILFSLEEFYSFKQNQLWQQMTT